MAGNATATPRDTKVTAGPNATRREQFLRLAIVTLGVDLARKVYPDVVALDPL